MTKNIRSRALGAFVGLAVGDALGAPVEFKVRDTFPEISEMLTGGYFNLPAGAWTDDTAMALCLADSLNFSPDFDAEDLLDRFIRWIDLHENTSIGKCIGVGQNTLTVLGNYRRTKQIIAPFIKGRSDGNGALMRVAPVAVRHFDNIAKARAIAAKQSRTTHSSVLSEQICIAMMDILIGLISGISWSEAIGQITSHKVAAEIDLIFQGSWKHKDRDNISSSGYVVDTFEAALWAVETTSTFENALIVAVNLGHDADTVGAVAGQLAGARYGYDAIPNRWLNCLIKRDEIIDRFDSLWACSSINSSINEHKSSL